MSKQKGRPSGYRNYSKDEVLMLSLVVQQLKPAGRNHWGRVKEVYDMGRPKSWPERDQESLKRKFKDTAATPKPTGRAAVPVHVAMAKLAQKELDEATSVRTMDDGQDDGSDDPDLLKRVAKAARAKCDKMMGEARAAAKSRREAELPVSDSEEADEETPPQPNDRQELDSPNTPNLPTLQSPPSQPHVVGVVMGRDGTMVDTGLAAELELSDEWFEENVDEEKPRDEPVDGSVATDGSIEQPPPQTPKRSLAGRPRGKQRDPTPTVTSPSRTPLRRHPDKAAADVSEQKSNPKKTAVSARLGGQDLRVFRDNIDKLAKRASSEASSKGGDTPYGKTKRVRTARKLQDLERSLAVIEHHESSGHNDIMEMMLLFRDDSERKTAAADARRREEREERERIRREEFAAAEAQRKQEREDARLEREERLLAENRRAEEREKDRQESRRQHEERLRLEREESAKRHEQMLLLFASLRKQ